MKDGFQYGGQAVIEGVMMRGPKTRSIGVRKPDDTVVVDVRQVDSFVQRHAFFRWPGVRGVVSLVDALVLGIEALNYSASQAVDDEEELSKKEIFITMCIGLGMAVLLFVILPTAATVWVAKEVKNPFWNNMIEGIIRLAVFLIYVVVISRMEDIKRVFQYHGAEHKVIHAYEAGVPLVPERVQPYPTLHPRCGTSFLLIVMMVSIFVFALLGHQDSLWWRILSRVLLLPVVAAVSYELLKLSSKHTDNILCKIGIAPGLWLQKLTTNQPDDQQVEVAIAALKAVLEEGEPVDVR